MIGTDIHINPPITIAEKIAAEDVLAELRKRQAAALVFCRGMIPQPGRQQFAAGAFEEGGHKF